MPRRFGQVPVFVPATRELTMHLHVILMPLFLMATAAQDVRSHAALMDEMEVGLVLPVGARPLSAYGRNYAQSGSDEVMGIFVLPDRPMPIGQGCLVSDGRGDHVCTKAELRKAYRDDARRLALQTPAGQRRWYASIDYLPRMFDGGCAMITLRYRLSAHRVESIRCNGSA